MTALTAIWKYEVLPSLELRPPLGHRVLHVDCIGGHLYLWAEVPAINQEPGNWSYRAIPTGEWVDPVEAEHVGTAVMRDFDPTLVFHVYRKQVHPLPDESGGRN